MNIVVFEDTAVRQLYPITLGRAAYQIACGSYRLIDWLDQLDGTLRGIVRPHLAGIQTADFPNLDSPHGQNDGPTLLINARLVPSFSTYQTLQKILTAGESGVVTCGESIAVALLSADSPRLPDDLEVDSLADYLQSAVFANLPSLSAELQLFEYPHDVIRQHVVTLADSLQHRIATGTYREVADGVFAAEGAVLGEHVVAHTADGPIVLETGARIGPYCYLHGPAHVGAFGRVIEHSALKDAVALGHTTKIGGEVEASVIEPYTNKQHHGFLGHSYLGSWINLGAGTCNSDLKNTYGNVKMHYQGEKVDTGMQFVGCIMGDYAKTAINTGIFTGKTIGVSSMVYGFVTTNVPSFVNYARTFGQVSEVPPEVMVATQQRMFLRRNVQQRPCDIQLIHDMHELTRNQRNLADEPLSL